MSAAAHVGAQHRADARIAEPHDARARARMRRRRSSHGAPCRPRSARSGCRRGPAPSAAAAKSAPRSKRYDASVDRPSRLLVLRIDVGSNQALSSAIVVVAADTSLVAAAHDAGQRLRAIAVGDDEHLGRQRPLLPVERRQRLAGPRRADAQRRAGERVEVERMQRMAELEQHVVGDVDDVADRADAGGGEPLRTTRRARARWSHRRWRRNSGGSRSGSRW